MKMTIRTFCLSLQILLTTIACAQYKTVLYDLENNLFNDGQPLPFETYIMLNGELPAGVNMIEFRVHKVGTTSGLPLYSTTWKRTQSEQYTFNIAVNYLLKQNTEYAFVIRYYYGISMEEKQALNTNIAGIVSSYLDETILLDRNELKLRKNPNKLHESLNLIVIQGLDFYRNKLDYPFPGFSDIVLEQLKSIDDLSLKKKKFYQFATKQDTGYDKREENFKFYISKRNAFKELVLAELAAYVNTLAFLTAEQKTIDAYRTERGRQVLPVNIGYGTTLNSDNINNTSFSSSPYVGVAFPLGNIALRSNILSKSSISIGAYLNNINDELGDEISGPFIGRPSFIGVGTRVFNLIRVNAGITALQKEDASDIFDVETVYVRPSVNLSIEIGLWLGAIK